MLKSKFLFMLTGSIACFKVCSLISRLVQEGHEVQCVASSSALKFIGEASLEGLTGKPVLTDTFASGNMMAHIDLARWADIMVIAPATANTINKLSVGLGDDLLSTIFLAYEPNKPVFIAPAMNSQMYRHPRVKESLSTLSSWGHIILPTNSGTLACGEKGEGRLLEPDEIYNFIFSHLNHKTSINTSPNSESVSALKKPKVLITSGGTQEPIDDVRFVTNMSTGNTGAAIANEFSNQGADVTYLHAAQANLPQSKTHNISFSSFIDLESKLYGLLKNESFDFLIHAAAVSDFSLDKSEGKISSQGPLTLEFKKNPKLIDNVHNISLNKNINIVAFKLTSTHDESAQQLAVSRLFRNKHINRVIHNDVNEIQENKHPFHIYDSNQKIKDCDNKQELAQWLFKEVNL